MKYTLNVYGWEGEFVAKSLTLDETKIIDDKIDETLKYATEAGRCMVLQKQGSVIEDTYGLDAILVCFNPFWIKVLVAIVFVISAFD